MIYFINISFLNWLWICKEEILQKDVKNLVSTQIVASWQAISAFDCEIDFTKGENNSPPDLLTIEFLQGKSGQTHFLKESQWVRRTKRREYKSLMIAKLSRISIHLKTLKFLFRTNFTPFSNYPPLPYKNVAIGSPSRPQHLYFTKHIEHLFLSGYKAPP